MAKKKAKSKTDATKWLDRISCAKKVREEWRKQFRVSLAYEYWEGRQRPPNIPEHEWITINMIYSTLLAILPTLYKSNPYFYVKLRRSFSPHPMDVAAFESKARIRQAFLNYLKDELDFKPKARLSIFDAFFQYGVAKVHFKADEAENPDAGKPYFGGQDEMEPLFDDGGQPLLEPDTIPVNEAYVLTRVHPDDFLVDEDAGPLAEDVSWKAHRIKLPLDEAKDNKRFAKSARDKMQATELSSDQVQKLREQKKKGLAYQNEEEEPEVIVTWEIYDLKKKEWLIIAEGCEEFLVQPAPIPAGIDGDPFVDLRLVMRDDSWYPMPPVSQWLDSQREYCEARSKVQVHRKRFNRKYSVYLAGLENEMEATKLETGDDGTIIFQNQIGEGIINPIRDAPLDQQVHTELSYLRRDFDDLAVGANQRGSAMSGVDSATEAGIMEVRSQVREGDWQGLVADFAIKIAEKVDQQVQAHITQDQAVKVSGPQGEEWALVRARDYEQIAGEFEYAVNMGAVTPQLPEVERAQWQGFLSLIGANPWLAMSRELLKEQAKLYHIENDVMIDQLIQIAQKMASGALQNPPAQGSMPGVSNINPESMIGGAAMGSANVRGGNFQ